MDIVNAITQDERDIRDLLDQLRDNESDAEFLLASLRLRLTAHDIAQRVHLDAPLQHAEPAIEPLLRELHSAGQGSLLVLADAEAAVGTSRFDDARSTFIDTVLEHLARQQSILVDAATRLLSPGQRRRLGKLFELRRLAELEVHGTTDEGLSAEPTA
ncbi:MAG: hypothetical protein ACRD0P_25895 [Stackebrandtia sp.]